MKLTPDALPRRAPGLKRLSTAVLLAAALAGCATQVPPSQPQVVADALPSVEMPGAWATAAERGDVPDGWLQSFNDAQLEALVGEAMQHNLDLRIADARLNQAAAAAGAAGAALKPTVDLAGGVVAQDGTGSESQVTSRGVGLTASWELDVWGRLRTQRDAATALYEGAALDREFAVQSIAAATGKAYFLVIETQQQVKLADRDVAASEEIARVIAARRGAGKANEQDVRLARSQVSAAKDRRVAAVEAQSQATRALEALLGRYPGNALSVGDDLPALPGPVPAGVPSEVLERRPDVAAAERRVRGAFLNVRERELARLPSFSLTATAGANSDLTGMTNRSDGFFNVGANFFAPILDGGLLESQVQIATAEQEQALAAYGQVALRALVDVENALSAETSLRQREELLSAAVADGEEALRLRGVESGAGKADTLSVLQLQRQVYAAKAGLISLRTARLTQRIDLHLALGGDFAATPPTAEAPATPTTP